MSQKTKDMIKERNQAQLKAATTKDSDDWRKFKQLRNQITTILRVEKKQWRENKLLEFGNDTSSIWKNVKIGWVGQVGGHQQN